MKRSAPLLALSLLAVPAFAAATGAGSNAIRQQLPNGMLVIVVPTSRLPLVDFRLVTRAGSVNDPAGKEGLAGLTAQLLTQGAGKRNARQIADAIEFVGGELDGSAGAEQTVVSCEVLQKDLPLGIELVRDVIVSPAFTQGDFERKRDEALGQIASDKSEPSTVADNQMTRWFWEGNPMGHPVIGWEASVKGLTRDDVARFHDTWLTPERSVLLVVGAVEPASLLASLRTAFAGWKPGNAPKTDPYGAAPPVHGRSVRIVNKPEATQAQIRMMCPAFPRNHPDWYAVQIANTILGGGFTSRLVNSIRVEQGLTYSIGSGFSTARAAGTFGISTFTRNDQLRKCLDATLAEVKKLVAEGPTDAELQKARNYLKGQFPLGLQSPDQLAAEIANVEFFGLPPDFIATYPAKIDAVADADVRRVLKTWFCTDDLKILVVTNGELAKQALAGVGALESKEID